MLWKNLWSLSMFQLILKQYSMEKNGILVKEQTPEAFADALIELLLNDKLRKISRRNRYKCTKENLDFDIIAENFIKFVESYARKEM